MLLMIDIMQYLEKFINYIKGNYVDIICIILIIIVSICLVRVVEGK